MAGTIAEGQKDRLDPQSKALLRAYESLKDAWESTLAKGTVAGSRAFADATFAAFRGSHADLRPEQVIDLEVPGGEGSRSARLYRPLANGNDNPGVVLFLHGGGWMLGGIDAYDGLAASLAVRSGAAVLSLDYRLAPEHPFPAGLDDALAAMDFLAKSGEQIGCDPARIAIMGDSAGGNLAAVVAREAALTDLCALRGQFLIYPMTDVSTAHEHYGSRRDYGDGEYFLTNAAIDYASANYIAGADAALDDPRISPLLSKIPANIAPALTITAGHDPLRDEAYAYHARLIAAGISSRYICAESTIHAFMSFGILDCAQVMRRELATAIAKALNT